MRCKLLAYTLLVAAGLPLGSTQATPADSHAVETIAAARGAVDRGDWKAALEPLEKLVAQSPDNGEFRLSLARARYLTGDYAGSAADYKMAFALKAEDPAIIAYGVARCDALLKQPDEAIKWLGTAVSLGYRHIEDARTDDALVSLHGNAEYRRLVGIVDQAGLSRDDGWRGDIRFLADWIERKSFHPFKTETTDRNLSGAVYTQPEFEAAVAKLIADVPAMSDRAIEVTLFRLVAALGDGHTAIVGSRTRLEYALTLPLGFYVFDDGVYIVSAAPGHADLVGAKVLALDGMPVDAALARIDPLIAHDNTMWVKAMEPQDLRHVPMLKELGIAKAENAVALSLELHDGSRKTVQVDTDPSAPDIWNALPKPAGWSWIADNSTADFQRGNDKAYWWKWVEADGILYVQYNKIADGTSQTLAGFAQALSAAIGKYPVRKLVVDMRNNNGGDTYLNEPLLWAVAGNPKVNQVGHLYVIIGRRTFSAAMNAVSYFGKYTKAVFVGEPTGGKPNAPGDETFFTLPYSGIVVNLSDRYWQGTWPDDFSDWRAPDIAAPVRFDDFAAGRDAAMQIIEAQPSLAP
jgi:hypothetical protein